jgi:hypothetical protein
MKTLFSDPVGWSERAAGTWLRFSLSAAAQLASFFFLCWLTEWRYVWPLLFFVFLMPFLYLVALRGVICELHRKSERHEPVA